MQFTILCLLSAARLCSGGVFEVTTAPIRLRPGEVHNRVQKPIPLPDDIVKRFADSSIALTNYSVDLLRTNSDGVEEAVPLSEIYNHHFILYMGSNTLMHNLYDQLSEGDPLSGAKCNNSDSNASRFASLKTMHPAAGLQALQRMRFLKAMEGDRNPAPKPMCDGSYVGVSGATFTGTPAFMRKTDLAGCCALVKRHGGLMNYVQKNSSCSIIPQYTSTSPCDATDGCTIAYPVADTADPYLGGATGGELRHNPHKYPAPYAFVIPKPESFTPVLHIINTKSPKNAQGQEDHGPSKLIECPCTSQRKIDVDAGTIDGCLPDIPFSCNDELAQQHNPGCSLRSYTGGYRCCKHGVFVADTSGVDVDSLPYDTVYLRFKFWHADTIAPSRLRGSSSSADVGATGIKQLHSVACCDATSNEDGTKHQVEYTVPACAGGRSGSGPGSSECVHMASSLQPLDWFKGSDNNRSDVLELVHAAAHMHTGGLKLELIDDATGELLCSVVPTYGRTAGKAGDEAGYLVGSKPCVWGPPPLRPPPRFRRDHLLRTVAYYNSTVRHDGVMSLWLMAAHQVAQ